MIICSSILSLVGPFLIGHIIDTKIIPKELNGLPQYIILLAIVYIMLSVTSYIGSFMMVSIAQRTVYLLRNQLFKHFQTLHVAYYDQKQHGELMSRMQNDIENVSQVLNSSFIQFTSSVVTPHWHAFNYALFKSFTYTIDGHYYSNHVYKFKMDYSTYKCVICFTPKTIWYYEWIYRGNCKWTNSS